VRGSALTLTAGSGLVASSPRTCQTPAAHTGAGRCSEEEAAGCRGGSGSEEAAGSSPHLRAPSRAPLRSRRGRSLPRGGPRRGFPPLPGAPVGPREGAARGRHSPCCRAARPRLSPGCRSSARPGGRAAPPYTGGGSGTGRPARQASASVPKFACIARVCIHLHRRGCTARQPAGCIDGAPQLPASRGHG